MKSDSEIKQWIDERGAMTQAELGRFIYETTHYTRSTRTEKWWGYVLSTKNFAKLRQYRVDKINSRFNTELFDKIKGIYLKDKRLQGVGHKLGKKLLRQLYGVEVARSTYQGYLKRIRGDK